MALKKERLEHALKVTLTAEEREKLWEFGRALREAQEQEGEDLSGMESSRIGG